MKTASVSQEQAKRVLEIEAHAIAQLIDKIDERFDEAVNLLFETKGRVIVTGMGKPGFIARKIAATFASTGTPSLFLHPAEAVHGDLGMVTSEDVVLAISNSGETDEITRLLSAIKKIGASLVAMTGNLESTLAQHADIVLDVSVEQEACPLGMAPTTSTTVALAMGDALAAALLECRGFSFDDFAVFHPAGSLGKKLLKVKDIMRTGDDNPVVSEVTTVKEALLKITKARAGSCVVINESKRLVGIFTDGDLRRHLESDGEFVLDQAVGEVATKGPLTIQETKLAAEAVRLFHERKIDELPVVDEENCVVGLLDIQDLLKAGLI